MFCFKRAMIALVAMAALLTLTGLAIADRSHAVTFKSALQPEPLEAPTLQSSPTMLPATPTPTATRVRREHPAVTSPKVAPTTFLPGRGPALPGELVYTGRRIDVYAGNYTFTAEQVAELGVKAERALTYIQRRFAVELTSRASVGVYSKGMAPSSDTRGIAYTDARIIRIFYRSGEDTHKALVILAHELAHQLQAEAYGTEAQSRADTILLEGLATWIAGEYWLSLSGAPSWQACARELVQAGYGRNLLTLGQTTDPDVAYELWAAFVDYLANTYGWDKFNALYTSGRGRAPGSADYMGIYGKSLSELADEWRTTLQ